MPIKITKPSNKAKTLSQISIPDPFIDYISITFTPSTEEEAFDMANGIHTYQDDDGVVSDAPFGSKGAYARAKKIVIDSLIDKKKWPLFQWRYTKGSKKKEIDGVRVSFVPKDLGAAGILDLKIRLQNLGVDWWSVVINGNVTRMDVSVDYPDMGMNDFLYMPKQAAKTNHWYGQGKLETIVVGRSTGNQTSIYDRGKKREDNNQTGYTGIRIERRLRNLHKKLSQIKNLSNPFESLTLVSPMPIEPPKAVSDGDWAMFCDSVSVRGLENALSLLKTKNRMIYRSHFKDSTLSVWQAEEIWAKWPEYLKETGLLEPVI